MVAVVLFRSRRLVRVPAAALFHLGAQALKLLGSHDFPGVAPVPAPAALPVSGQPWPRPRKPPNRSLQRTNSPAACQYCTTGPWNRLGMSAFHRLITTKLTTAP